MRGKAELYFFKGKKRKLREIADITGIKINTILTRISRGWSMYEATGVVQPRNPVDHTRGVKQCNKCNKELPLEHFFCWRGKAKTYTPQCKGCMRDRSRDARMKARLFVLKHYGGSPPKCKCGETRIEVLDIHHLHGNGCRHVRTGITRETLAMDIIAHDLPDDYGVLCRNCNWMEFIERKRQEEKEKGRHASRHW